jgi:hypothetical protein
MNKAGGRTVLVLLAIGVASAYWWSSRDQDTDIDTSAYEPVHVTYHVTGSADGVDITFETPDGTAQGAGKAVPLGAPGEEPGMRISGFLPGDFVYISAQNTGEDGTVTCRIVGSDGATISENTSDGAYAIATCNGMA